MLNEGTKAPDFTLLDKDGKEVKLNSFLGKKVVIYFYSKDNTPGCTRQACAFKNAYDKFRSEDVVVIGISKDSVSSHEKFATKYELPFILLSDENLEVIKLYDLWVEKKQYGKTYMGTQRSTYIIDEKGNIIKAMKNVKPDTNTEKVLEFLF